jgi:hypothetical protein
MPVIGVHRRSRYLCIIICLILSHVSVSKAYRILILILIPFSLVLRINRPQHVTGLSTVTVQHQTTSLLCQALRKKAEIFLILKEEWKEVTLHSILILIISKTYRYRYVAIPHITFHRRGCLLTGSSKLLECNPSPNLLLLASSLYLLNPGSYLTRDGIWTGNGIIQKWIRCL